ncbi:MAG: UDP-N-acetylmuramoyl-L-alanine--D-glutamate ligase [Gammaproteobacteria bacterium]|nr:UDP-N-acetylmuramoyl-L-alanine--D-glutamate ligase [Gammaproteobacteria bacterium]
MKVDPTNYLVIGAGVSGLSVVEYLLAKNKQCRIIDSRGLPPNAAKIKNILSDSQVCFGQFNQQWLKEADVIVLSPGVSPHTPEIQQAVNDGAELLGDIELFAREASKPYIAITGSNGKSTVTTLVAAILESQGLHAKACANIGEPALNLVDDKSIDMFVLELSSFQLETCSSLSPDAAVVLNISDDHLDRHSSFDEYAHIKQSIYTHAKFKVVPREQGKNKFLTPSNDMCSFGTDAPDDSDYGVMQYGNCRWLVKGNDKLINCADLPLLGVAGEQNTLAALALTDSYIKHQGKALEAIRAFKGLPHRCEIVLEKNGVQWIDDSKGTNVGATVSAILGLSSPVILILGGVHKGGSLESLIYAVKSKVELVVAFGRDKQVFIDALSGIVETVDKNSLTASVEYVHQKVKPGQSVLFSPACASFDMFSNYIERGLAFQAAVKQSALKVSDER